MCALFTYVYNYNCFCNKKTHCVNKYWVYALAVSLAILCITDNHKSDFA